MTNSKDHFERVVPLMGVILDIVEKQGGLSEDFKNRMTKVEAGDEVTLIYRACIEAFCMGAMLYCVDCSNKRIPEFLKDSLEALDEVHKSSHSSRHGDDGS